MKSYEQKYKAALEWMQGLYSGLHGATKEEAEHYFPELKDSEDERIRKAIHIYLDWLDGRKDYAPKGVYSIKDMIAWLEKQGNKFVNIDVESMVSSYEQKLESQGGTKCTPLVNMCLTAFRHGIENVLEELNLKKLEKQGEQKHFSVFKAKDWYVSKVDGKIHNMTYNPTDKVEPKFKIGNWITDGRLTCKVLSVTGKSYELHLHNDDYCHFETDVQSVDKRYHLWTIQDAMDGDVLVHNGYPFIFMGIKDGIVQALEENLLEGTNPVNFGEPKIDKDYHPATKEQRDVLFAKMKEAGYEWNNDKKELNKIEQKNPIVNVPPRELILSIWDLGNEWKELTNGSISTEYGTQLEYIQKHWQESSYYDNIGDNIPTLTDKDYDKLFINCKH